MHKFKERCDICNKLCDDYDTSTGKVLCQECFKKNKNEKLENKNEVNTTDSIANKRIAVKKEKPMQPDIFDYLFRGM